MDHYQQAISTLEREGIPLIGPSVDRRALNLLTQTYNDENVRALACFVCGQKHVATPGANSAIEYQGARWLESLGIDTLEANVGWARWEELYGSKAPLNRYGPGKHEAAPLEQWCCDIDLGGTVMRLFGCPEDWRCHPEGACQSLGERHPELRRGSRDATLQALRNNRVFKLCKHCSLPICKGCRIQLATAHGKSNVPMALANDQWYGYVQEILARLDVRWIECAAASLAWTTQIIYQLDTPHHGHMMLESMTGAQNRIAYRGNVFSFMMPWEDIITSLQAVESGSLKIPLSAQRCGAGNTRPGTHYGGLC
jgi:hypothetical protein